MSNIILQKALEKLLFNSRINEMILFSQMYKKSLTETQKNEILNWLLSRNDDEIMEFANLVSWTNLDLICNKSIKEGNLELVFYLIRLAEHNKRNFNLEVAAKFILENDKNASNLDNECWGLSYYIYKDLLKGVTPKNRYDFDKYRDEIEKAGLLEVYEEKKEQIKNAVHDARIHEKNEAINEKFVSLFQKEPEGIKINIILSFIKKYEDILTNEDFELIDRIILDYLQSAYDLEEERNVRASRDLVNECIVEPLKTYVKLYRNNDISFFVDKLYNILPARQLANLIGCDGIDYNVFEQALVIKANDYYDLVSYMEKRIYNKLVIGKAVINFCTLYNSNCVKDYLNKPNITDDIRKQLEEYIVYTKNKYAINSLIRSYYKSPDLDINQLYELYFKLGTKPEYDIIELVDYKSSYFYDFINMFCQSADANLIASLIRKLMKELYNFDNYKFEYEEYIKLKNKQNEHLRTAIDNLISALSTHTKFEDAKPIVEVLKIISGKLYNADLIDALYKTQNTGVINEYSKLSEQTRKNVKNMVSNIVKEENNDRKERGLELLKIPLRDPEPLPF